MPMEWPAIPPTTPSTLAQSPDSFPLTPRPHSLTISSRARGAPPSTPPRRHQQPGGGVGKAPFTSTAASSALDPHAGTTLSQARRRPVFLRASPSLREYVSPRSKHGHHQNRTRRRLPPRIHRWRHLHQVPRRRRRSQTRQTLPFTLNRDLSTTRVPLRQNRPLAPGPLQRQPPRVEHGRRNRSMDQQGRREVHSIRFPALHAPSPASPRHHLPPALCSRLSPQVPTAPAHPDLERSSRSHLSQHPHQLLASRQRLLHALVLRPLSSHPLSCEMSLVLPRHLDLHPRRPI
ncbi:hypothetical protein ES708_22263 [subsurface metagenome]